MPDLWTPPTDPDKPNCPYMPGFQTQITTHNPPPPFGSRLYGPGTRPTVTDEWLSRATQSEHVLAYPPLATPSPAQPQVAKLAITKTIAIGNARGAQLVVCVVHIQDSREPFSAVAKIFDPLYYSFSDKLVNKPVDVVRMADIDYSREAAAYEHLRNAGNDEASFAPLYFGSWTFNLPISHAGILHERPVHLVLIEYLDGSSMKDLYAQNNPSSYAGFNAFHYAEKYRLEILACIMDGAMKQIHKGLTQGDLAPRNIILVPQQAAPAPNHLPRVVLVDYNNSIVYPKTFLKKHVCQDLPLPPNPMEAYWNESLPEFAGWIPDEWCEDRRRQEWLMRRFGGDKKSLYAPLTEELEFT